jgi:2-oxoisovalerate dehydrogenase E1 component alpha subunit
MQGASPAHVPATSTPHDDVLRVLRDDGSLDPATDPRLDAAFVLDVYQAMVRVRALDERLVALQRQGRIGFHIGSQGEEAAILGSAAALRERDWIFPCYREFGAALWRGMKLDAYVDHMFGNEADPMKGRQMPDHFGAKVARFTSISSPVGTQITQAAGFAWAAKIKKDDVATLVYFGEGATSAGEFHNGMNFAGVFRVPLVLFCRNNGWAQAMPAEKQTASPSFAAKGVAYGVPGVRVDGNDLFAVVRATRDAVARAAAGEGPTLIEALTTRMASPKDPEWRRRDPVARVRRHLEARGAWSDAQQRDCEDAALAEIEIAVDAAERRGPPGLATMFDDVFGAPPAQLAEQREELLASPRARGPAKPQ